MQREETDRMGQMERGRTAEVQPDCMTEAYTVGIYQRRGIVPHGKYACR